MKELRNLLPIMLILSLITSCLNNKQAVDPGLIQGNGTPELGNPTTISCNPPLASNTKDSVSFNSQILPFFTTNCASSGCHDSKTRAEGYDLSTYKSIISRGLDLRTPKNSKIYTEMLSEMPPFPAPKLAKSQTDLVLKWITEGAKNVICSIAVDTANVTFSKTIKPLLETNCVGCHKIGSVSGGVLLDSYNHVKA